MKSRMILAVLMTLALVASSVGVGYAGGGAGQTITDTFFDCYEIQNGNTSPYTLSVTDRFGDHQQVRLGKSRLLCTPTSAISIDKGPAPALPPEGASEIKCYDIQGSQQGSSSAIKLTDSLGEETVTLTKLTVLCTPVITDPPLPQ